MTTLKNKKGVTYTDVYKKFVTYIYHVDQFPLTKLPKDSLVAAVGFDPKDFTVREVREMAAGFQLPHGNNVKYLVATHKAEITPMYHTDVPRLYKFFNITDLYSATYPTAVAVLKDASPRKPEGAPQAPAGRQIPYYHHPSTEEYTWLDATDPGSTARRQFFEMEEKVYKVVGTAASSKRLVLAG